MTYHNIFVSECQMNRSYSYSCSYLKTCPDYTSSESFTYYIFLWKCPRWSNNNCLDAKTSFNLHSIELCWTILINIQLNVCMYSIATENRIERMKWKATYKFMEFISKITMPVTVGRQSNNFNKINSIYCKLIYCILKTEYGANRYYSAWKFTLIFFSVIVWLFVY